MAKVKGFKGLRYNDKKISDISKVIAPPYDVINQEQQELLYSMDENNIIKIDVFISGNKSKKDVREKDIETISDRLSVAVRGFNSSYGPTKMHIMSLSKAKSLILEYNDMVEDLSKDIDKLKNQLESATELLILD